MSPGGTDFEFCNKEREERLSRLSTKLKCLPKSPFKAAATAAGGVSRVSKPGCVAGGVLVHKGAGEVGRSSVPG